MDDPKFDQWWDEMNAPNEDWLDDDAYELENPEYNNKWDK